MNRYYESDVLRQADRTATEDFAIPGIVLMENAGRGAAEILLRRYPEASGFVILCGPGNNGGDGFVLARHLQLHGAVPVVIATLDPCDYRGDASTSALSAQKTGVRILRSQDLGESDIKQILKRQGIVVDALLGTGSSGAPRGEVKRLVDLCGRGNALSVVSLDIPSSIDANTGEVCDTAITAELTITFLAQKPGLAVVPGAFHAGTVEVCHIGICPDHVLPDRAALTGYDRTDIESLRPAVSPDVHKGSRGALMIVGGSDQFRGAPLFTALGALRAGCGLVFLAIPDFAVGYASAFVPEAMFIPLETEDGFIRCETFMERISPWTGKCDALVLGPGLGRCLHTENVTRRICEQWDKPLLLDADALHHLGNLVKSRDFHFKRDDLLITPHEGEAAHLLQVDVREIVSQRLASCKSLAETFGTALLKGPHSLVANSRECRVILEGGPSLAVPGSGDVLSGAAGAFLASGMSPVDAATLAAIVHGVAGTAQGRLNGLLAREIAGNIRMEDFENHAI